MLGSFCKCRPKSSFKWSQEKRIARRNLLASTIPPPSVFYFSQEGKQSASCAGSPTSDEGDHWKQGQGKYLYNITLCVMPEAEWRSGKLSDLESENLDSHVQPTTY